MQRSRLLFILVLLIVIINIVFAYYGYQIFKVETRSVDRRQEAYQLSVMNLISKKLESIINETEAMVIKEFSESKNTAKILQELHTTHPSSVLIKSIYFASASGTGTGSKYMDSVLLDHKKNIGKTGRSRIRYFRIEQKTGKSGVSCKESLALSVIELKDIRSHVIVNYNIGEVAERLKSYIKEISEPLAAYIEITDMDGKIIAESEKLDKRIILNSGKELRSIFTFWKVLAKHKGFENEELQRKSKVKIYIEIMIILSIFMVVALYVAVVMVVNEAAVVRLRSDFVSTVSHDLKTPLSSIKMYSELIEGGRVKDKKKLKYYLATIITESERLTFLINNILEFSGREYRLRQRFSSTVDLKKTAANAIELVKPFASQYGYKIKLIAQKVPLITGDAAGLNNLVMNLLDNAVKYSPVEKQIMVEVAKEGRGVRLSVKDKGIGIEEKEIKAIFQKFYRAEDPYVKTKKGVGIGLSIVKQIALEHGARIEVESKKGKGSTFSVIFKQEKVL